MKLIPRPYQEAAINATFDYFAKYPGNPIISIPTGGGKALVLCEIIKRAMQNHAPTRVLQITHVKELLKQNFDELVGIWPEAPAGLYSAGLNKRQVHKQITIAGIQSIYKKGHLFNWIDIVVIDEVHLLSSKATSMYQKLLTALRKVNPNLRLIGLSATPWRSKDGHLVSEGGTFTDVCFDVSMKDLIQQGYLAPLVSKGSETKVDMKGVKTTGADYNLKQMAQRFDKETITKAAVSEICELGKDRKKWLIFCCDIKHAYHVRDEFRSRGISCEAISGDMDKKDRARFLDDFKNGDLQCITNYGVLTTGFNNPKIDLIGLLRSTKSSSLYSQILGRGSRLAPEKQNCRILDYGGNLERHGPVDKITVEIKNVNGKKTCEIHVMPTKLCPTCFSPVHARSNQCPDCGYVFPAEESAKHERKASTANVLSGEPQWFDVKSVGYYKHSKLGKPDMIKATYFCGVARFTDYLCLFHGGYAQEKAMIKWMARGGQRVATVEEALEMTKGLKAPRRILVDVDNKYPEVKRYEY